MIKLYEFPLSPFSRKVKVVLPKEPVKRAKARMMDEAFDNYFMAPLGAIFMEKFMKPAGQANEAVIKESMVKLNGYPRVQAWLKRVTARPAYQKSEPSAEFMKGFQEATAKMRGGQS